MAVVVNSDASAFKRSANVPPLSGGSIWGWFYITSVPSRFWGPIGTYAGTDGAPSSSSGDYVQVSSASSGSAQLQIGSGSGTPVNLVSVTASNWYFIALTTAGVASGNVIGYVRALTANTLTSAASGTTYQSFTAARIEWGRDAFAGDYMDGRIHACGASDAVLSADELLQLSFFSEPQQAIRSLNVFYPTIESVNTNASIDRSANARNATATVGALADSPPILWRPPPPLVSLAAAAGGAITGSIPLTLDVSAALTGAGALAGSIPLSITPSGALTGAGALAGAVTLALTPTGALTGAGALAGSLALTLDAAGALLGAGALAGSVALSIAPVGALTGAGALAGTVPLSLAVTGSLTSLDSGAIAGTVSLSLDVTSALTGAGALIGAVGISIAPSGALTGSGALAGSVGLSLAATGTLSSLDAGAITGAVPLTIDVTGALTSPTAANSESFSGGFFFDFEHQRERRQKRQKELDEAEEQALKLKDDVDREIAEILQAQERKDEFEANINRLKRLVGEFADKEAEAAMPERVRKSLARAQAQGSVSAFLSLQRELDRQLEEEEFAVLMMLAN